MFGDQSHIEAVHEEHLQTGSLQRIISLCRSLCRFEILWVLIEPIDEIKYHNDPRP